MSAAPPSPSMLTSGSPPNIFIFPLFNSCHSRSSTSRRTKCLPKPFTSPHRGPSMERISKCRRLEPLTLSIRATKAYLAAPRSLQPSSL